MKAILVGLSVIGALCAAGARWPPIGPDVTGGTGAGGHAHDIPAKRCRDHTVRDTSFDSAPVTLIGMTWASGVVTASLSNPAGFSATGTVTVAGVTPSGYNGTFGVTGKIYTLTVFTITYALAANPGGSGTGGTMTQTPQILAFDAKNCYVQ